jgi:hypothetical protein
MTSITRHSGAACVVGASAPYNHGVPLAGGGRNPVQVSNMQLGFVRFAELFYSLDSGLRRNDEILSLVEKIQ